MSETTDTDPSPAAAWRWRRAAELAAGDPPAADDDPVTLRAAVHLAGGDGPHLADVRAAAAVHAAGGLRRRAVQAYLLTTLPGDQVAARTGLPPAAVAAYAALFFPVREAGPLARELRAEAWASADPLVRAARRGGVRRVEGRVRREVRARERFLAAEEDALLAELVGTDPAEQARAKARITALAEAVRQARGGY